MVQCLLTLSELDFMFYIEFSIEKSDRVLQRVKLVQCLLTLSELDFMFYIEFSIEKSDRVLKRVKLVQCLLPFRNWISCFILNLV